MNGQKIMKTDNSIENEKERLCVRILQNCRNRLYADFPYLDGAFASVGYQSDKEIREIGTDGDIFFFSTDFLLKQYRKSPEMITRGYLHMLLHCLYLHCFPEKGANPQLWNLACDMAVELMIEKAQPRGLALPENLERQRFIESFAGRTPGADHLYRQLIESDFHESVSVLQSWFSFDDPSRWYSEKEDPGKQKRTKQKWEKILGYTGARQQDHQRKRGEQKGGEEEEMGVLRRSRYDYRKFLKKFAVPREEMEIDLESFDYIFYNLGMETYGDMPLIEPLEYQEVNKLEELVIAIDTSGSCDVNMVRQFLSETYKMLSDKENFFKKMKVYLIQCDCCIQDVQVIRSEEEWTTLASDFKIQGRGGTDFRPVFTYVEQLRKKKELRNLKALIYFTDGDGVYPREKPDYETAFVFVNDNKKATAFPEWALKLIV